MISILMMSAKLATPGLQTFVSCGSNSIVDVFRWPKFMREVIITSNWEEFDQKNWLFKGCSQFKFNNLGLVIGITLKFCSSVAEELTLKVSKFLGLIPTFGEVIAEKC